MNRLCIFFLYAIGCNSKTATLDTSLGEPSTEPSLEPSSEEPTTEPATESIDEDGDGVTIDDGDCDDTDPNTYPQATDIAGDGIDQDCDGVDYNDGLCTDTCTFARDGDCDDGGPAATSPLCDFGTDCSDCGSRDDMDQDGFYDDNGQPPFQDDVSALLDCDDSNPNINPSAQEIMNDGIDQDCNGEDLTELCTESCAGTGNGICEDGGSNSSDSTCTLGSDCSDCGSRIDGDMDGFDEDQDCDDADPAINPDAEDICNGLDEDCDGDLDEDFDETEPNDASNPYYVGSLEDGPQLFSGKIAYEGDQDGFHIYTYDGWFSSPSFTCTISAPPDLNLDVILLDPLGGSVEEGNTGLGGEATVSLGGSVGDDTGNYLIIVDSVEGNSCSSTYTIDCQK